MRQWLPQRRIARSLVALIFVGIFESVTPSAQAAVLPAPTITSITAGNASLTVNMVTSNNPANFWTYTVTRRDTSGSCANPYSDGVNTNTGTLSATISLTGLTNGCNYLVRVAGNLSGIGNFAEIEGMPTNFGNYLNLQWANDAGAGLSGMVRTPFSTGCKTETVTSLNYSILGNTSPGGSCNTTSFTGYFSGYIKAPFTGAITFTLSSTDDAGVFAIQGNTVVTQAGGGSVSGTVSMIQDQVYRLEFWYHNDAGPGASAVTWSYNGGSATSIPVANIANDPSVLATDGGCSLGMAARCAAGSAYEIKQATGTNFDGQYWINIGGTATLVYCIMNSVEGGGGWMLAMRGKNSQSTFNYESAYWTNSTLLNSSYPERFSTSDTYRNTDAKYAPFTSLKGGQIMALYPEVSGSSQTGGAWANNSNAYGGQVTYNSVSNGQKYGFAWYETYNSGMTAWTTFNSSTGFGGDSSGYSLTNAPSGSTAGPTGASSCPNTTSSLQSLFTNSVRCVFRQVKSAFDVNESPYSAIGNNIFFSQTNIRFFGINYGNSSTGDISKVRFGFGWNENGDGIENSNDGNGGIGIYDSGANTLTAGTYNGCCSGTNQNSITTGPKTLTAGQTGMSGGDGTSTALGFELYVRNNSSAAISGQTTVRVSAGRLASGTVGQSYSQAVTSGSATYRITPMRPGFNVDPSTGTLKVSSGLATGTYYETVTATDANGASGAIGVTINVVADSNETDTALSFTATNSQYISSSQQFTNTGDFTIEGWFKPSDGCSNSGNQTALYFVNAVIFCRSGFWYGSVNTSGTTWNEAKLTAVRSSEWVHIALTKSSTTMRAYVNNMNVSAYNVSTWAQSWSQSAINSVSNPISIGGTGGTGQYFNGVIDEVKIFNNYRSVITDWASANIQENVSNSSLIAYYDFNEGIGSTTTVNRAQSATSASDITVSGATSPTWVTIATYSTSGPYTVITVPRSIINSIGGWRAPDSVTAITVDLVAGGGGGGGGYEGGGGGAGGFIETTTRITPKSIYSLQVGIGGRGVFYPGSGPLVYPNNGDSSTAFGFTAIGGGSGALEVYTTTNTQFGATSGGSGGGGSWANYFTGGSGTTGQGKAGGNSKNLENGNNGCVTSNYVGSGGGGAATVGSDASCSKGGDGGFGALAIVTGVYVSGGGGGSHRSATSTAWMGTGGSSSGGNSGYTSDAANDTSGGAASGTINTGGGGGASMSAIGTTAYGGNGGSGVVAFRYITALKPTFTQPKNTYLNVGMTETFTTNVAQDSATAVLTRTFRWESSTTGSSGTFSLIKLGTGAANAAFAWVPTDTSTSGSNYVYRVIVTDSDTAGLFIVDTSTAVFAVINKTLTLTSKSQITKTVGVTRLETFTVSNGTPTYSYTLSPPSPFFWIDTTSATTPRIRISDTATVGTYYETFTVTDSVSASIVVPLTIVISAPPSFSASSAQVDSATVLYLDAGNTASYPGTGATLNDLSGRGLSADLTWSSGTTAVNAAGTTRTATSALNNITCVAPNYDRDGNGSLLFNGTSNCAYVRSFGNQPTYTYEVWIKRNGGQTDNAGVITNPNRLSGDQMNWVLSFDATNQVFAGIYNGTTFSNTPMIYIPNLLWTHIAVSYDGATLSLTVNGETTTTVSASVTWNPAIIDYGVLIGRKYNDTQTYKGLLASLRFYSRALSLSEIRQNYNATKTRFDGSLNENTVAKKYASRFVDTYTVTAGSETLTATFTTNALSGIKWDTSTTRSLVLTLLDTLTPGTYYDTITATDIYGSSTRLPITFVISKADTVTVYYETSTALSYTGSKAVFTPSLKVTGLVGLETGTSTSAALSYKPGGASCATGGYCRVGDIGPGGGIVFIDTSTASSDGRIYEVAPANWSGSDDLSTVAQYCSNTNLNLGATQIGIGWGDTNTTLAKNQCLGGAVAKVNSFNQSNSTGYSDWFIPSTNEAIELIKIPTQAGLVRVGSNWTVGNWGYWTSTEVSASDQRSIGGSGSSWNVSSSVSKSESTKNMVRPVRAFISCWAINTCSALATTETPTAAGTYSTVPSSLSVASGSLSNYIGVNYISTPLTINKVAPTPIVIPWINTNYPDTFTVNISVRAGTGNLTFSATDGTASGCALDYRKIYTTTQGTCTITIARAADRNFLADTVTGTVFFLSFVFNQPATQVGGGATIGLNGVTALETSTVLPPAISILSTLTLSLGSGGTFTITGSGFTGTITVKFWRNKIISATSSNGTTIEIPVSSISSAGATSGRIAVITSAGEAVSVDSLTITP